MVSSGSSVAIEMRLPVSSMTSLACWFHEPAVSSSLNGYQFEDVGGDKFAALLAASGG